MNNQRGSGGAAALCAMLLCVFAMFLIGGLIQIAFGPGVFYGPGMICTYDHNEYAIKKRDGNIFTKYTLEGLEEPVSYKEITNCRKPTVTEKKREFKRAKAIINYLSE